MIQLASPCSKGNYACWNKLSINNPGWNQLTIKVLTATIGPCYFATMSAPTIFDRIRALEHLTPSETKIAQYLDKAYPLLALETVTSISERARVGRATVVRFISRLGYSSFAEFQQSLRKELLFKLEVAGSLRQGQAGQTKDSIDPLRLHCELIARNLEEACRRIDKHQLRGAMVLKEEIVVSRHEQVARLVSRSGRGTLALEDLRAGGYGR